MSAILGLFQIVAAAAQGAKAIGTLKKPPPGTKTITANVSALVITLAAWLGFSIPMDVVGPLAAILVLLMNLWLRKLTTGPLPSSKWLTLGSVVAEEQPYLDDPYGE